MKTDFISWWRGGSPWIWFNAGAVAVCLVMVVGLVLFLGWRGLAHFWLSPVMEAELIGPSLEPGQGVRLIGQVVTRETVSATQLESAGITLARPEQEFHERLLLRLGNRDVLPSDFAWVLTDQIRQQEFPQNIVLLERTEWGNFYGYLESVQEAGQEVAFSDISDTADDGAWLALMDRLERVRDIRGQIEELEQGEVSQVNYRAERLRLRERELELSDRADTEEFYQLQREAEEYNRQFDELSVQLTGLYNAMERDSAVFVLANGVRTTVPVANILRAYQVNEMNIFQRSLAFVSRIGSFLSEPPREANTEGGVFPAIFGTVMMVLLMSVIVTPLGVVAAVYLREYARQGIVTRIVRIAVNNLAGVPSIVYGVFGLGFFIYLLGGEIDRLFYPEALPAPTFGTPGLLWASLTLALLTLPVVIVATEEGLARIPASIREGSIALGATRFETLWRVVLPMATPAMMTGLILAVARAAGEVAPLMLVGVVKLAPSLPLDGNFPFLHVDRQFMHLGFHIYEVGFQSPNIEAARPLVFATAFLLVVVIASLNISAVFLRNRLRERYRALDAG